MTPREIRVPANGGVPNNPRLPALVYAGVLEDVGEAAVGEMFERNGWVGRWVWTVYPYHHWHPASHEALAVLRGAARLRLGGEAGEDVDVAAGDGLLLPAGFGHRLLEDDGEFAVMGAYPSGQERPEVMEAGEAADRVGEALGTPVPPFDPFLGETGPLTRLWQRD